MISFNKPYLSGKELQYIGEAVSSMKISGDGAFTKKCHSFFETKYGFGKCLLTTSCTDALEMAALLIDIQEGDEIIMPSYTFVSTANAFVLRGAKIVFADSEDNHPNMDASKLAGLITPKTKAIVPVHYAGIACDMDSIMELAKAHNLYVIEDAAQSIDSYYKGKPLGSFGHFATFSFHETKNIIAGEGGMLVINDKAFYDRAEIIREKGTNRSRFFRGEVDKYGWVDIGSSFLPSDMIAAFLFAQLENLEDIQKKRISIWNAYYRGIKELESNGHLSIPRYSADKTNNAHMFCIVLNSIKERTALIQYLKANEIYAVFHYLSLHKSPFYSKLHDGRPLPNADKFENCLLRLPIYYELKESEVEYILSTLKAFFQK